MTLYALKDYITSAEKDSFIFWDNATVKLLGYEFNFRPYCKRYFVKDSYGSIREVWHFDKTAIRKNHRGVIEIIEA